MILGGSRFVKMLGLRLLLVMALTTMLGCKDDALDPSLAPLRDRFLTATEPPGAISLAEARNASMGQEVVVVGQIDGEQAWETGKAVFVIRELIEDDAHGGAGHDAANCPFCKRRRAEAPMAV